jgi:hypothetical protein
VEKGQLGGFHPAEEVGEVHQPRGVGLMELDGALLAEGRRFGGRHNDGWLGSYPRMRVKGKEK